ncbi:MAG: hypothetical protein VCC04_12580, partial [Myxococcota bacterium]
WSCQNVFVPSESVNCPYGGWDHEARVSQGRIISATRPLLHFLDHFYINGSNIGAPLTGGESLSWKQNHTGSLRGTNALARQRGDGVNYVVLFNERSTSSTSYTTEIRALLDDVIETEITDWPEPVVVPALSVPGLLWLMTVLAALGTRAALRRPR